MHENEERTPAEIAHYKNRLSLFRRFVVRLEEFKTKLKASGGKSYTEEWVGKDEKGYKVLRFWNNEILTNMDGVLEIIRKIIIYGK